MPAARPLATVPLGGSDWTLRLTGVHPRDRGVPGDESDPPAGLEGRDVPATVPGCVHTDLLAAGLIPDPYLADHERQLLWTGRCDWSYRRAFDAPADALDRERVELCFDGVDTIATVLLNGAELARTRNMHRRYRFDVKGKLREAGNELEVRFRAAVPEAFDVQDRLGKLPHTGGAAGTKLPHHMIRKMSCNMGWDWGPIVPTAGLWRGVRLEAWDAARLGDVRPVVRDATEASATLEVHADVEGEGSVELALTGPDGETFTPTGHAFTVASPELWWPVGHGDQPLYTLTATLKSPGGETLATRSHRVGLRTVELDASPDGDDPPAPAEGLGRGAGMTLLVNGRRVYCKGFNWVPDDCFPARIDRGRYARRVDQAVSANVNMLRVWGGGLFESHDFYEVCDERGVMVWQDFLMACACYHEDEETLAEVEAEARDNVSRLARHPSLVLLNGCNENLMGYYDWKFEGEKWPEAIGDRPWGLGYYFGLYPRVCGELAPDRPYWPASPTNGPSLDDFHARHANANEYGNRHVWDVWHGPGHYLNYLHHFTRFCSEFGFHGPACWPTVEASIPEDQRRWDSPVMRLHNKNGISSLGDGQDKSHARMADDFDPPEGFDDWLYLSQVMQARALAVGVGWWRSLSPWNSGALIWQLNDCWPVSSWSAIDNDSQGRGRPKPLLHAARRFFAPRVVNLGPRSPVSVGGWGDDAGPLRAYLHNDHPEPWAGTLRVRRVTLAGETIDEHARDVAVPPRGEASVDVPASWARRADTAVVAELAGGVRSWWWFAPDKELAMPRPKMIVEVADGGRSVTVKAGSLLRDLCLFADRVHGDAEADDACVTLLPGESHLFRVTTPVDLDRDALTRPPALRCVGDR